MEVDSDEPKGSETQKEKNNSSLRKAESKPKRVSLSKATQPKSEAETIREKY